MMYTSRLFCGKLRMYIARRGMAVKLESSFVSFGDKLVNIKWPQGQASAQKFQCYRFEHYPVSNDYYSTISVIQNSLTISNIERGKTYLFKITPVYHGAESTEPAYCGEFTMETAETDEEISKDVDFSELCRLDIRVGKILEVKSHPEAEKLYIEKVDVGDAEPRTIVSGLADYLSKDELLYRHVIVLCNLKPRALRGVMSDGMLLCASNDEHSSVDPLAPPPTTPIGQRVYFPGCQIVDPAAGNRGTKAFTKVVASLQVDSAGVASFNGVPFTTTGGVCTSKIPTGRIS